MFSVVIAVADASSRATTLLAAATAVLAVATVVLAVFTFIGIKRAREDAATEISVMRETTEIQIRAIRDDTAEQVAAARAQLAASHRPLFVEVLPTGPDYPDMGGRPPLGVAGARDFRELTMELAGGEPDVKIDARSVFVKLAGGSAFVSVPLRNVGRGLGIIDMTSMTLRGTTLGALKNVDVRRARVPVGETTRIDIVAGYQTGNTPIGTSDWTLSVRYTDFAGEQATVATIALGCPDGPQGPWYITAVEHES